MFQKQDWLLSAIASASITLISTTAFAAQDHNTSDNTPILILAAIALLLIAIFYMLPTIVAFSKDHPNRWVIGLLNFVFGATVLGWVGCLIWALHRVHHPKNGGSAGGESGLNLYVNDEKLVRITGYPNATFAGSDNASNRFREPTFDTVTHPRPPSLNLYSPSVEPARASPSSSKPASPPPRDLNSKSPSEPPPIHAGIEGPWYYFHRDQQIGPISATEIRRQLYARQIKPTTLVWREGMTDWHPLSETELFSIRTS